MTSTSIVKLNIGGTVFNTTKSTLTKFDGFFKTLLETDLLVAKDEFGCIFVDRSPKHFDTILNFMRDGDVVLPDFGKEVQEIQKEAEYYLLQDLIELCGGELPKPAKTETSKGVRVVQSDKEMEQLRDESKHLLCIRYAKELSECFLKPWSSVCLFVQKHESQFDIFLQPSDDRSCTIEMRYRNGGAAFGSEVLENVEDLFSWVEKYTDN